MCRQHLYSVKPIKKRSFEDSKIRCEPWTLVNVLYTDTSTPSKILTVREDKRGGGWRNRWEAGTSWEHKRWMSALFSTVGERKSDVTGSVAAAKRLFCDWVGDMIKTEGFIFHSLLSLPHTLPVFLVPVRDKCPHEDRKASQGATSVKWKLDV